MDIHVQSGTEVVVEQQQPLTNVKPYHASLCVVKRKFQFKRRHDRVAKTLAKQSRGDSIDKKIESDEYDQVPHGSENGELDGAQLCQTESAAAARPKVATNIKDVIERIVASDNLSMPNSPPKRMPLLSQQRDGKSFNGLIS